MAQNYLIACLIFRNRPTMEKLYKPQIIFEVIENKIESTAFILCLPQQTQNVTSKKAREDNKEG
jgi:hypothetical protein